MLGDPVMGELRAVVQIKSLAADIADREVFVFGFSFGLSKVSGSI